MTEINPVYIPCAAGTRTQTDFLIRPCPYDSALIEILGHPIMDITPQDARKAAFALLAIADRADICPMGENRMTASYGGKHGND